MGGNIRRGFAEYDIVIPDGTATSSYCPISNWSMASIHLDTMDQGNFQYQVTNKVDATDVPTDWAAAYGYDGVAIGNIVAVDDAVIPVDPRVMQARFFRIAMQGGNETGDKTIKVLLKG